MSSTPKKSEGSAVENEIKSGALDGDARTKNGAPVGTKNGAPKGETESEEPETLKSRTKNEKPEGGTEDAPKGQTEIVEPETPKSGTKKEKPESGTEEAPKGQTEIVEPETPKSGTKTEEAPKGQTEREEPETPKSGTKKEKPKSGTEEAPKGQTEIEEPGTTKTGALKSGIKGLTALAIKVGQTLFLGKSEDPQTSKSGAGKGKKKEDEKTDLSQQKTEEEEDSAIGALDLDAILSFPVHLTGSGTSKPSAYSRVQNTQALPGKSVVPKGTDKSGVPKSTIGFALAILLAWRMMRYEGNRTRSVMIGERMQVPKKPYKFLFQTWKTTSDEMIKKFVGYSIKKFIQGILGNICDFPRKFLTAADHFLTPAQP